MAVTRRELLRAGAIGFVSSGCARVWALPEPESGPSLAPSLVVVVLRGGVDGLHLLPPLSDPDYVRLRGPLAVEGAPVFDGGFGLHPALAPLLPWVDRGWVAAVPAAGLPHGTRSHFEAQDRMETGIAHGRLATTGWLGRALAEESEAEPLERLSIGSGLPLTLAGCDSLAFPPGGVPGLPRAGSRLRDELLDMYRKSDDAFGKAGIRGLEALTRLERAWTPASAPRRARRGAGLGVLAGAEALLALERDGVEVRAAVLESDGWDTHSAQGLERGRFANAARDLARGLARLLEASERRQRIVVTLTEFGRSVHPNGAGGTDHGSASALFVCGNGVRGGLYGRWPGLDVGALHEERDLAVATDSRNVLAEVLRAHTRRPVPARVFPDFDPEPLGFLS